MVCHMSARRQGRSMVERAFDTLDRCFCRFPSLTLAAAMVLTGVGILAAVGLASLLCALPLGLLMGWL